MAQSATTAPGVLAPDCCPLDMAEATDIGTVG
jgi:hypothetical protein